MTLTWLVPLSLEPMTFLSYRSASCFHTAALNGNNLHGFISRNSASDVMTIIMQSESVQNNENSDWYWLDTYYNYNCSYNITFTKQLARNLIISNSDHFVNCGKEICDSILIIEDDRFKSLTTKCTNEFKKTPN